jgi:hypothetical protein
MTSLDRAFNCESTCLNFMLVACLQPKLGSFFWTDWSVLFTVTFAYICICPHTEGMYMNDVMVYDMSLDAQYDCCTWCKT